MKILRNFLRVFTGLVFIFSGFVKGVDPMGFGYKIEDYFIAFGTHWAEPLSLSLSVILCALEFSLGVYLLLNIKTKQVSWLVLGIMVFFFFLTLNDAIYNPVPDCGCFGDAVKLTNWQTFYKNILLLAIAIGIFSFRKTFTTPYPRVTSWILAVIIPLVFIGFEIHNLRHLPFIDFSPWKVGTRMVPEKLLPVNYYLTYQNKNTKETREMLSKDLPWNDSVWMKEWEFKSQRIDDPNHYIAPNFKVLDTTGNDVTSTYLRNPGYQLFIVAVDLDKTNLSAIPVLNEFISKAEADGISVIGLTTSLPRKIFTFREETKLQVDFYQSDDTELKIMVRSNPGLVLLQNSQVKGKWAFRDIPGYAEFKKNFIK